MLEVVNMEYCQIRLNKVNLHLICTPKFKKIEIDVKFKAPIKEEEMSYRSLLPYVLRSATKNWPNKKAISEHEDELYGANFEVITSKTGTASIMNFFIQLINEKYLKTQTLLQDTFLFLKEIIGNPYVVDGSFSKEIVKEEKRLLIEEIEAIKENKASYALKRLYDYMFSNEQYRLNSLGEVKDVAKINEKSLYNYYLSCLQNNEIDVVVTGDINKEEIKKLVSQYFDFGLNNSFEVLDYEDKMIDEPKRFEEKLKASQSQLCIGYRTSTRIGDQDHFSMMLMNLILGGYSHSLLFTNVREKASLAYYVSSRYDGIKGVIFIQAGISKKNKEDALRIVLEQVTAMIEGSFSDEIIDMTKKAVINDLLEANDSIVSLTQKAYNDMLLKRDFNINYGIDEINKVTKEEIMAAAKKIKLDTIYFLLGE